MLFFFYIILAWAVVYTKRISYAAFVNTLLGWVKVLPLKIYK